MGRRGGRVGRSEWRDVRKECLIETERLEKKDEEDEKKQRRDEGKTGWEEGGEDGWWD